MKRTPKNMVISAGLSVAVVAIAGLVFAGPLAPPSGVVAPTYKTLVEVEPRVPISPSTAPGDASSLFKITQPGSYYLTGNITGVAGKHGIAIASTDVTIDLNGFTVQGVQGSLSGVTQVTFNIDRARLMNGSVTGWGEEGVDLAFAANSHVEGICSTLNGRSGILCGTSTIVTRCTAANNSHYGINLGQGGVIDESTASFNDDGGIVSNGGSVITRCRAVGNGFAGIHVSAGSSSITDCMVVSNLADGILVASGCMVRGNLCRSNSTNAMGAGIHATGYDNRIEANNCCNADRGILIDSTGNFINRNTCSGNQLNYVVAAGNACYVVNATMSGAISGNSGGLSFGSSDPNANFAY